MVNVKHMCVYWGHFLLLTAACDKSYFEEIRNYLNADNIYYNMTSVGKKACTRLCRMHAECYAFNMLWDKPPASDIGTCQLLTWENNQHADHLQAHNAGSYFGHCPGNTKLNVENGHCYGVIEQLLHRQGATAHCPDKVHPRAHLVDVTSADEHVFVNLLVEPYVGNKPFHTAGERAGWNAEFRWKTTDDEFAFNGWLTDLNYPKVDPAKPDNNCVFISYLGSQWGWGNWRCDAEKYFVCEF